MAQIFPRWTNKIPLLILLGKPAAVCTIVAAIWYWGSPEYTDVGYAPTQPIPFSHQLHAGEMGIDCRYCHNTAERGAMAAIPPTATCMNCHATIDKDEPVIQKIHESYETGVPIKWIRVHMLPDYAFFDHSVHLAAGVGCISCHGRVDTMKVVRQEEPLSMSWCLECHRNPTPHLRPREEITNMLWDKETADYDPMKDTSRVRQPNPPLHCSGCHR